ncbi:MAG TPA: DNA primase [Pyrinomonadaceae bacterium]|nr:DNA primase [Pyrinomonadaceae bacterium]
MHFPQYVIDDLKVRADLVRIIQPYAQDLKKKGASWMACCPFHQEKTPSFSVNPAKGFYKCFGCGKGGTAFNFLMEMEGLNFPEAVKRVAEMSGYMLPELEDDESFARSKKAREEKKALADQIIELNQVALDFWQKEFAGKSKDAKVARKYIADRGLSDATIENFRLGFSPDKWDSLLGLLRDFGADDKLITQSGLVSVNEDKDRTYDRFRGRVMFPVLDVSGKPVAFGARAIKPDDNPKYLNSPETAGYTKGDNLYGLFQAKDAIRRKGFAILVEGYLDLIALVENGIENVVASLGTAFTDAQAKLLSRFTKRIVINYDGDSAGTKAARRAIELLLPHDFDVKVLVLPDGKDPDDFVRQNGEAEYNVLRGRATPFLQFALSAAAEGRKLSNAKQKAEAVEEFLPVITAIRNHVQQRESFDQAMDFFGIDDSALRRELWQSSTGKAAPHMQRADPTRSLSRAARAKVTVAEKNLLKILVHDRELAAAILPRLERTDYENLATAELYEAFIAISEKGDEVSAASIVEHLDGDETTLDLARELLVSPRFREDDEAMDDAMAEAENCVFALRNMAIRNRIEEISREAAIAEQENDPATLTRLLEEQLELEKIRRTLEAQYA